MIAQAVRVHRLIQADRQKLVDENTHLRRELKERYDFSNLVGTSGAMRQVYEQVAQVARTSTTVLLRGESGTGKELIAHALHYNSSRAKKPFIKVSCAALPQDLIESELFGYEKGAFTGAHGSKKGRFEIADGGTLFLDEIGDLNLATQVKLLRVLQERAFERLGGTQTVHVDLRLVTATNKDLEKAIAAGEFREDLYYRLNVFTIYVAPLRERKTDILLLADHFLEKFSREHGKNIRRISTPAIDMLMAYHWPGNVRELANAMERAVVVCDANAVHAHHLPPTLQTAEASDTSAVSIPLSILTSIIVLSFLHETINVMTLGGLALAVGILVDDATVVIENVNRILGQGKEVREAILEGAQQIAVPALVSTLCISIVFIPMFFLNGVARYLFVPLAEAVVFAMMASYILSRTLVPTLAMYLLRPGQHGSARSRNPFAMLQQAFERGFEKLRLMYELLLTRFVYHRRIFVPIFLLVCFICIPAGSMARARLLSGH